MSQAWVKKSSVQGNKSLNCRHYLPGLEKCLFKPALFLKKMASCLYFHSLTSCGSDIEANSTLLCILTSVQSVLFIPTLK